jgi:hypothetical protein
VPKEAVATNISAERCPRMKRGHQKRWKIWASVTINPRAGKNSAPCLTTNSKPHWPIAAHCCRGTYLVIQPLLVGMLTSIKLGSSTGSSGAGFSGG